MNKIVRIRLYNWYTSWAEQSHTQVFLLKADHETEYFNCPIGVKQGDSISATLFSIFINDLAKEIKNTKIGLNLGKNVENGDLFFTFYYTQMILFCLLQMKMIYSSF